MIQNEIPPAAPVRAIVSTSQWLKEMGAVRPMAVASDEVLVLGAWHRGHYPILWQNVHDLISRDINGRRMNPKPMEEWHLFGVRVAPGTQITQDDCERILSQVRSC